MNRLETNIFPILNLPQLSSRYRLYRVRGLSPDQDEYERNIQLLSHKLSLLLHSPVTAITRDGEPYLVLQEDAPEPPSPFQLVRATAYFDATDQVLTLDYEHLSADTEVLCLRFLQFAINGALYDNPYFWQPSAGKPFYERRPVTNVGGVSIYRGYAIRVVIIDPGQIGLCVDVQHKYVSQTSLPPRLSRDDFRRFKHTRCIYRFGREWYEIRLHDHTGLNISEQLIPNGSHSPLPLVQYIREYASKPLPREVVELDPTSAAVSYLTTRGDVYSAAAALCYPLFETSDPRVRRAHRETILQPHIRRSLIHTFVRTHLGTLRLKEVPIQVAQAPLTAQKRIFLPPDLAFGKDTIYSVRGSPGASYVSLDQLGQVRLGALLDPGVGPHATRPLDRQYIIIPQSVADSYGPAFLKDLRTVVNRLYPQEIPYDPIPITYNDLGPKTFAAQGRAILTAVDKSAREPGYGIVMLHETVDRKRRQHDQLAAMAMRELRKRNLYMAVIHTTVPQECYQLTVDGTSYQLTEDSQRRKQLKGYLRNVAINKVLLTNERWPFVFATPLHADLSIAIDVRLNTACFTFIGKEGPDIRTHQTTSNQKERLSRAHVQQILLKVLREEARLGRRNVQTIVIQRDGRLFEAEIRGIREAVAILKQEGCLPMTATLNFVEIPKTSPAPFRLFDVERRLDGREFIQNPQVGTYVILTCRDGYICSTGREFRRSGTVRPLQVKYVEGALQFDQILEDVYAETCLAWTRPEDCTRYPMTIKLADIRLSEHAGGYDEDDLEYVDEAEGDEENV